MRTFLATTILVLILLVAVLTAPAGAAPELCNNTYGGDLIYAKHLGCGRAREVVRAWARAYKRERTPNVQAIGFDCHGRDDQIEGLVVFCRRAHKRVTFFANVP